MLDLGRDTPPAGSACYLDTSVLLPLTFVARGAAPPIAKRRDAMARALLTRMKGVGATACSTILALEELAALVRREARRKAAQDRGLNDWHSFQNRHPQDATAAEAIIRNQMLDTVRAAVDVAGNLGIAFRHSRNADDPKVMGKRVRLAWTQLLRSNPSIDPMDALHFVYGSLLGVDCFASFDRAWGTVSTVDVYVGK